MMVEAKRQSEIVRPGNTFDTTGLTDADSDSESEWSLIELAVDDIDAGYPQSAEDTLLEAPDGKVEGGTLPALVEGLTMHEVQQGMVVDFMHRMRRCISLMTLVLRTDQNFLGTFLLTYESFTTFDRLFDLLAQRYRIHPPHDLNPAELEEWTKLKQHIVQSRSFLESSSLIMACTKMILCRVLDVMKTIINEEEVSGKNVHIKDRIRGFLLSPGVSQTPTAKLILLDLDREARLRLEGNESNTYSA